MTQTVLVTSGMSLVAPQCKTDSRFGGYSAACCEPRGCEQALQLRFTVLGQVRGLTLQAAHISISCVIDVLPIASTNLKQQLPC